jgi:Rrf2 family iron-sulfur cluster assembly transcriptional regulator
MEKDSIDEVKLSEVVNAIDGNAIYRGCGLGLKACDATKPCPLHDRFAIIRNDLQQMLDATSIYELASGLAIGRTFLKR